MDIEQFIERDDVTLLEGQLQAYRPPPVFVVSKFEHIGTSYTFMGKGKPPAKNFKTIAKDQKGLVTNAITLAGMYCIVVRYVIDKQFFRAVYWGESGHSILELRKAYY